ncbi:MAG: hypothetical protein HYY49_05830 [Ignavibacteriales bacterium]|nr:hypothetical protein [Ignavibacteriales bacterium]
MKFRPLFLLLSLTFFACTQDPTPADESLIDLYAELILLSEEYKQPSSGMSEQDYQQKTQDVLEKYKTTKGEFAAQIQDLSKDQQAFRQFIEMVQKKLQERRDKN